MKLIALVLICVVCNVAAQAALKLGSDPELYANPFQMDSWFSVLFSPWILGGVACWTLSTLLWIYVLSGNELSLAYGLYGLNYVLTPLAARWVFQEFLQPMQMVGIALITLGVGLTVLGRNPG